MIPIEELKCPICGGNFEVDTIDCGVVYGYCSQCGIELRTWLSHIQYYSCGTVEVDKD